MKIAGGRVDGGINKVRHANGGVGSPGKRRFVFGVQASVTESDKGWASQKVKQIACRTLWIDRYINFD